MDGRNRALNALPLLVILAVALTLRVWGFRHGLPFVYSYDENAHFVPWAVRFFEGSFNPGYFRNPPGFTYLVHGSFRVWFLGRDAVKEFESDPGEAYSIARLVAAAVGTLVVWLVYLLGSRLFERRVGLVAAGIMAVAFLPVSYSHVAVNDVPALAPETLSLIGSAGVLSYGRRRDYVVAGVGLGLACATKYTSGIALLALLVAVAFRFGQEHRDAVVGFGFASATAFAAFVVANPYALLDFSTFANELRAQSGSTSIPKPGMTGENGFRYYLWTLTWGLGWLPALAAGVGAVLLLRDAMRRALFLLPLPLVYFIYMGSHTRFFGRWLLPAFPVLCVLAAYAAVRVVDKAARSQSARAPALLAAVLVALTAQGLVYTIHNDVVLSRTDTRSLTRAWMLEHIPTGTPVVIEPLVPPRWLKAPGERRPLWKLAHPAHSVERHVLSLRPELLAAYERDGSCWIVTGSLISGRAFTEPEKTSAAVAYYAELARRGTVAYRVEPWDDPVPFNFDWSFLYYPLAYQRPGAAMTVYRLHGGRCATA
jgi:hypothetical protein